MGLRWNLCYQLEEVQKGIGFEDVGVIRVRTIGSTTFQTNKGFM
jgi:hypothetical protein